MPNSLLNSLNSCPTCGATNSTIMNPSHPTIHLCLECERMWNPLNHANHNYQNAPDPETVAFNDCDVPSYVGPQPDDEQVVQLNMTNEHSGLNGY